MSHTVSKFRKRKRKSLYMSCVYTLQSCSDGRGSKCTKKRDARAKLLFWGRRERFQIWYLNIHEHWTRVSRFNPLWVSDMRKVKTAVKNSQHYKSYSINCYLTESSYWSRGVDISLGKLHQAVKHSIRVYFHRRVWKRGCIPLCWGVDERVS